MKIGIIDYQIGNHISLTSFFENIGAEVCISNKINTLLKCNIVVLPGVGSFDIGMKNLKKYKLDKFLLSRHKNKLPIIGICLGMQLLGTNSFEGNKCSGLNIIPGSNINFKNLMWHNGWNNFKSENINLAQFKKNFFYFNHSYYLNCSNKFILAHTNFKNQIFPGIVMNKKTIGFQFHPENSQNNGINLLTFLIETYLV